MAVLLGTTAAGTQLPVEIDSTGRVVCIGEPGPQGPIGPTGAVSTVPGPQGPQGPQGNPGIHNTSASYQVAALGIGQAAGTGTELDLAGRYAQTSIAVAALDIDCSLGNYYTKTVNGNITFTFSNVPASRSYSFALSVTHDSGTITWPASVKWPKNTAPTLNTSKKHMFMFSTHNGGSVFYASALVDFTY